MGSGNAGRPSSCLRVVGWRKYVAVKRSGGRVSRVDLRGIVTGTGSSGLKTGLSRGTGMKTSVARGVAAGKTSSGSG